MKQYHSGQEPKEILKTKQWLEEIIIGLNFCPFAKKEFVGNKIDYVLSSAVTITKAANEVLERCFWLQQHKEAETSLLLFNQGFDDFQYYLDVVDEATNLLFDNGFEGEFQLASFHPDYCFAGEKSTDPANYTNRSPLPIIHIIREESLSKVLSVYKHPEQIPEDNILLAREKGNNYFEQVLQAIADNHR